MHLTIFLLTYVITLNSQNMADTYSHYLKNQPKSKLNFKEITPDITLSIIDGLKPKTSCGIDEIYNKTYL